MPLSRCEDCPPSPDAEASPSSSSEIPALIQRAPKRPATPTRGPPPPSTPPSSHSRAPRSLRCPGAQRSRPDPRPQTPPTEAGCNIRVRAPRPLAAGCPFGDRLVGHVDAKYDEMMRTTIDLPDDLHRAAMLIARDRHQSLSRTVANLMRSALVGDGHDTSLSSAPASTGVTRSAGAAQELPYPVTTTGAEVASSDPTATQRPPRGAQASETSCSCPPVEPPGDGAAAATQWPRLPLNRYDSLRPAELTYPPTAAHRSKLAHATADNVVPVGTRAPGGTGAGTALQCLPTPQAMKPEVLPLASA
jgi:Arc/MetJ family transcription regulator